MNKIKYYVYISDTKVDMIYGQIPQKVKKNIATELKIDLKIFSVQFSEEPRQDTRYSKLQVVTQYLEKYEDIGSIEEPAPFFRGTLFMKWGPVKGVPMVYFGTTTESVALGLGGSLHNVIGGAGEGLKTDLIMMSASYFWSISEGLKNALEGEKNHLLENSKDIIYPSDWIPTHDRPSNFVYETLFTVMQANHKLVGSPQKLEFLAKRLVEGTFEQDGMKILLGSPIYVALAE